MKSRAMRVFVGSLLSFSSVFVLGQRDLRAQSGYGSVAGTVRDASGAAIAEVSLRIINLQDNTVQSTVSGAAGEYQVPNLKPGSYEIVATKAGLSFSQVFTHTLGAGEQFRADFVPADPGLIPAMAQELEAMKKRIELLEAELQNTQNQTANAAVRQSHGPLLAMNSESPNLPVFPGTVVVATDATAGPQAPATPAGPPPDVLPKALAAPDAGPAVDNFTPFAFADFTWLNGNSRDKDTVLDTKFFTPEVRFDTHYMEDMNQPLDHTIVGATESFRSGEVQIEQASVGGDFHWDNVRGRILFMQGLFATTTPRNDASSATGSEPGNTGGVGQWDLQGAYKYISEAWGGYHFNVKHGLNVDAGIFVSYIGLFSYYNYDNWTYQPSFLRQIQRPPRTRRTASLDPEGMVQACREPVWVRRG
ncbi:MAG: TonB-dependent receptor [Bryobacteraceae bacterium]